MIRQGNKIVGTIYHEPTNTESKGIELTQAEYDQLEKDGNVQPDVDYYISDGVTELSYSDSQENVLRKDFYFEGKTVQFFGDSITTGVGVDDDSSDLDLYKRWTTTFCSLVKATELNSAVSGSLYTRDKNEVQAIVDTVQTVSLTGDIIMMCGGINDWQLGVPLDEFTDAVDETFSYLKNNFNGDVVVVSPFNAIKNLVGTPITNIYEYRLILSKLARKYQFSFIDGSKLSLGKSRSTGLRIKCQYADGLHPSGFGHYLIGHEMMFQFTGLTWQSYSDADAGTIRFSGEYLQSLEVPIWKVVEAQFTMPAATDITNMLVDARLTNARVILQGYTGCVMYNTNYVATLPYYNTSASYITDMVFYSDAGGLQCQHKNTLDITNGNIFFTFIRYFDMNNRHTF